MRAHANRLSGFDGAQVVIDDPLDEAGSTVNGQTRIRMRVHPGGAWI